MEMDKRKWFERILCFGFLAVFALGGYFAVRGVPLPHRPKPEHVISVEITAHGAFTNFETLTAEFSDKERIELACGLVRDLRYRLNLDYCKGCFVEPEICLTFTLADGSSDVIGTARGGLYRNGRSYSLAGESPLEVSARLLFYLETQE